MLFRRRRRRRPRLHSLPPLLLLRLLPRGSTTITTRSNSNSSNSSSISNSGTGNTRSFPLPLALLLLKPPRLFRLGRRRRRRGKGPPLPPPFSTSGWTRGAKLCPCSSSSSSCPCLRGGGQKGADAAVPAAAGEETLFPSRRSHRHSHPFLSRGSPSRCSRLRLRLRGSSWRSLSPSASATFGS